MVLMNTTLYIVLGVIAVVVLWVIFAFNHFVRLRNRVREAWSDIEVQLKRRYDLIPNLIETVSMFSFSARSCALPPPASAAERALVTFSNACDSCLA